MKRIVAIFIAICLLAGTNPIPSFANDNKKKKHKKHWLFNHKKRDRRNKWNTGHTEFKNRTKKDQRRLNRHHIQP